MQSEERRQEEALWGSGREGAQDNADRHESANSRVLYDETAGQAETQSQSQREATVHIPVRFQPMRSQAVAIDEFWNGSDLLLLCMAALLFAVPAACVASGWLEEEGGGQLELLRTVGVEAWEEALAWCLCGMCLVTLLSTLVSWLCVLVWGWSAGVLGVLLLLYGLALCPLALVGGGLFEITPRMAAGATMVGVLVLIVPAHLYSMLAMDELRMMSSGGWR